jgi:hypothetical protein
MYVFDCKEQKGVNILRVKREYLVSPEDFPTRFSRSCIVNDSNNFWMFLRKEKYFSPV